MRNLDYQQAFGAWDKTTPAMSAAIRQWQDLYYGAGEGDACQRIAYTVVHKLVRTIFSEYAPGCPTGFYSRVLGSLDLKKKQAMQLALVGGSCCIKPCPTDDGFDFTLIPRQNLLVFGRDSTGRLTDVGTVEKSVLGRFYYTLLERRRLENGCLVLENRLYRSLNDQTLGEPCSLTDHPRYGSLATRYVFDRVKDSVGLVELSTPMCNCVDGSQDSVSIYAAAVELIRRIDENESQLQGEFRRGESRIITSRDLLDDNDRLTEHLFVGLDDDPEQVGFHIFSPQLREQSFLARKAEYLRNVESVIGLQRGMLSDVNAQDRTATEIAASEGEYNLTVMDLQAQWEEALRQVLSLCRDLAPYYGLEGGPVPQVNVDWGNGILYDEDKLWADYKEMVHSGLLAPEVALGWRFGLPSETVSERSAIRSRYMPQPD